jgi:hypothetical protein
MLILSIVLLLVAILVAYALWLRPWLKTKAWSGGFFAWVEPIEIVLFKKSETILFARLKMVSGVVLMLLTQLGEIDLSPLMPFVPEKYSDIVRVIFNFMPLTITLVGALDEKLRNATTKPIELVAVPEATAPPEVKVAIAQADAAKAEAVAIIQEKKVA